MTERCHEHLQTTAFLDFHLPLFLCLSVCLSLSTCTLDKMGQTQEAWSQMHTSLNVFFFFLKLLLFYPYYRLL